VLLAEANVPYDQLYEMEQINPYFAEADIAIVVGANDVTNPAEPKLITSATGIAGLQNGHTFTPTPDGRYAVLESEYRYAPLRIIDLKPGYDGTAKTISRPIGAYTTRWDGLPHNHEVRWPYVFISHYEDGLRVINLMDPTNPYEVGFYDTYDGPIQLDKSHPFEPPTPTVSMCATGTA